MFTGLRVPCSLFIDKFSENTLDIKFHENRCGGSRVIPCEQIDVTKPLVVCRSSAHARKKWVQFVGSFSCLLHWSLGCSHICRENAGDDKVGVDGPVTVLVGSSHRNKQPTRGWSCSVVYCVCRTVSTNLTWSPRRKFCHLTQLTALPN